MAKLDERYFFNEKSQPKDFKDIITEDEQILWQGKPNKSSFILGSIFKMMPIAIIWICFDATFITMMIATGFFNSNNIILVVGIIAFFILHLTPVWMWLKNVFTAWIQHKNLEYVFTNKRIIIKSGVIGIDFQNVFYTGIESVNLKVGIIDRMFKVGDIYIRSDLKSIVLYDITNPYVITTKLQEIVNDIKTDVYFPNDYRPKENHGYNTKYRK